MTEVPHGPVEAAYRAWIATLGGLSPRQTAEAEHLYALAYDLDLHSDKPASAKASLSRAIARTADRLRDEKNAAGGHGHGPAQSALPADVVDLAKESRRRRQQGEGGNAS